MTRHHTHISASDGNRSNLQTRLAAAIAQARQCHFAALIEDRDFAALRHYRERLGRSGTSIMLGEAVPYLFSEGYPSNDMPYEKATKAWFLLYHHALVVDDLTDGHVEDSPATRALAARLLEKTLGAWRDYDLGGMRNGLREVFDRYYAEQVRAGRSPIGDAASLGHRGALVKYFVAVFKMHATGTLLNGTEERAIESLLAGFQILDDVTDCVEDGRERSSSHHESVITAGEQASEYLRRGLTLLAVPESADLRIFVEQYADAVDAAVKAVRQPQRRSREPRTALPLASN